MNKIILSSYMGSGSSAVTDLLSEYDNVANPNGSYEYIFMHCPNGVFDLEDKLLIGNNALRSDEALRAFETTMQDLFNNDFWWFGGYRNKISGSFMGYVASFLSEITTAAYPGFWYEQEKLTKAEWTRNRIKKKLGASHSNLLMSNLRMSFPSHDEFYQAAQRFLEKVLKDISLNSNGKTVLLDQLLLPHNLWRMPNYFDPSSTKAIVVDRDPRDVFALNKYVWRPNGDPVPLPYDADTFCACYRAMRESEKPFDSDMVLRVRFENLVFNYEQTVAQIEEFIGNDFLGSHKNKLELFNPARSMANVGVFGWSEDAKREAELIEEKLPEYLFPIDFENIPEKDLSLSF